MIKFDCVVEGLLKHKLSGFVFESLKKTTETGTSTPSFTHTVKPPNRLRQFSHSWYKTDLWLCGRKKSSSLYCQPCFPFSTARNI
jgi:hypothetical protein